jgi:hypothetical protein
VPTLILAAAATGWVIGRDVWMVIVQSRRAVAEAVANGHARARRARAHEKLDPITHDPFRDARGVLARHPSAGATSALAVLEAIETALAETLGERDGSASGNAFKFHEEGASLLRYGDPERAPARLRPAARDMYLRLGRTLDDVRLLHDLRIEYAVMLFTLWGRSLLLLAAPALGSVTFSEVPLSSETSVAANALWAISAAYAVWLAVQAPELTKLVLSRTLEATRLRTRLTVVEAPLAVLLVVAFPCWPVAAFAAGWTNWWQRNSQPPDAKAEFSWPRLAAFLGVMVSAQAFGLALHHGSAANGLVELLASLAAIGVVGGSYGAMFPLSGAVLVQTIASAIAGPRRARRVLSQQLERAIDELHAAAEEIEAGGSPDAPALVRAADDLRIRASAADHAAGRTPRDLADLIDIALDDVAPAAGSHHARARARWAEAQGDEEPISFFHPNFPSELDGARAKARKTARVLGQVVERLALEARAHGTGPAQFLVFLDESEMIWRMGNYKKRERKSGRGSGYRQLEDLTSRLNASFVVHQTIDSTFIEGTGANEIFGVEVRIPRTVLEA